LTKGGGDDSLTRDGVDGGGALTLGWGGGVVERTATRRGGAARCFRRESRGDGVAPSGTRRWGADSQGKLADRDGRTRGFGLPNARMIWPAAEIDEGGGPGRSRGSLRDFGFPKWGLTENCSRSRTHLLFASIDNRGKTEEEDPD
jgi:hypothetical protein